MVGITHDRERVQLNMARLKKGGETFEIVVEPALAIDLKKGEEVDIREVLKSEQVFSDAKKGLLASETRMNALFNTAKPVEVARIIIKEGEIQLTSEYRQELFEKKKKKIIDMIHRNAVDPGTSLPHPLTRIENAFTEGKVRIDEFRSSKEQMEDVIKQIRPILPLSFEMKRIEFKIPGQYTGKANSAIRGFANIKKEDWNPDGSWSVVVEIPAGMKQELFDRLNNIVHGDMESKILEDKK